MQTNPKRLHERKNGCIRRELLNANLFNSLADVISLSSAWRVDYNKERPHKSFGYLSPTKNAEQHYKRSVADQMFYPQTANENNSKIEESLL